MSMAVTGVRAGRRREVARAETEQQQDCSVDRGAAADQAGQQCGPQRPLRLHLGPFDLPVAQPEHRRHGPSATITLPMKPGQPGEGW
jgi:hypothetical protein